MYGHTFSMLANHQIRYQAPQKVGYQPGDYKFVLIPVRPIIKVSTGNSLHVFLKILNTGLKHENGRVAI